MNVAAYRENNRIEAKKALGGLPRSIWETYSAFANALGGVILLGVEEHKDTSLSPVDLPDPEGMVRLFWSQMRDGKTVSVNILTEEDVRIAEVDGKHIIAIEVPRARRSLRPVYIGGDPMTGTYRRNGEGDYRCKREEVLEMQRDAARRTGDMRVLTDLPVEVLDSACVAEYRSCLTDAAEAAEAAFLVSIGAAAEAEGGVHPTCAGLLMFGHEADIRRQYPGYSLEYHGAAHSADNDEAESALTMGGNLFDFYTRVMERLEKNYSPELLPALREALTNCLLNADYHSGGVVIRRSADAVEFSNPGQFRVDVEDAVSGGVSDPRNLALARMFAAMGVGRGNGSGLSGILALWHEKGWVRPTIRETFDPARVTVRLSFLPAAGGGATPPAGRIPYDLQRSALIAYVTEHIRVTAGELACCFPEEPKEAARCLAELLEEGILMEESAGVYRLKR